MESSVPPNIETAQPIHPLVHPSARSETTSLSPKKTGKFGPLERAEMGSMTSGQQIYVTIG